MNTIDQALSSAHETVDNIANAAGHAADAFDEKAKQLRKTEKRMLKDCQAFVDDNPLAALGMAAVAGFVLSRLLSSR